MVCFIVPRRRKKPKKQPAGAMATMSGTYRIENNYYAVGHIVCVYFRYNDTCSVSFSNGETMDVSYRQGLEILERMNNPASKGLFEIQDIR